MLPYLVVLKKAQYRTCHHIRDMSCHIQVCCYHDQARGFHGALRKHSLLHQDYKFYMLIEFNTFQKLSADSKLSTNTYLMSAAALFQKLS